MKITRITRDISSEIDQEILKALQAVEKKFGIVITKEGTRYSDLSATIKLNYAVVTGGTAQTPQVEDFYRYRDSYDIPKNIEIGHIFFVDGIEYRLSGLNMKSKKYPVTATSHGKTFGFPRITFLNALKFTGK
jgi:hypothetical protein